MTRYILGGCALALSAALAFLLAWFVLRGLVLCFLDALRRLLP